MTVIAWDGKTLAADKQSTCVNHPSTVTKINRVPGGLVGFSGDACHAAALLAWFHAGQHSEAWPKPYSPEDYANAIFISTEGRVFCFTGNRGPYAEEKFDRFVAAGSGRDYALAAMYLGRDARQAVEVAIALDVSCGMGIDELRFE